MRHSYDRHPIAPARRGNTMILVAGVLVLLTIIASAFITRSKGTRDTAAAVHRSVETEERAEAIADLLASEVAGALFVEPIDPAVTFGGTAPPEVFRRDSNHPRLTHEVAEIFYGPDIAVRWGFDPAAPFNVARTEVVPFTNWPDEGVGAIGILNWPRGEGAPNGLDLSEGNPLGNPGFGDARWLRDNEPIRWNTDVGSPTPDAFNDAFKYWRHLTNISRVNNGWRVVRDASDLFGDVSPYGGTVDNLNVPIEQWSVDYQPDLSNFDLGTGDAIFDPSTFMDHWSLWFSNNLADHAAVYTDPLMIPPNFYNLRNLDGGDDFDGGTFDPSPDGFTIDSYETPSADFVRGTARWNIGRVLADSDGDGFTDSFWFLAPTPVAEGVRQIVAMSIVDNTGLVNANVMTRFDPVNTIGETPADLALIGAADDLSTLPAPPNWDVGLLDAFVNRGRGIVNLPSGIGTNDLYGQAALQVKWNPARWVDFLDAIGVGGHPSFPNDLTTPLERRLYWLYSGVRPFEASFGLTPFELGDELELRMFHGRNYAPIFSRFERSMTVMNLAGLLDPTDVRYDLFRSHWWFRESNQMADQMGATSGIADAANAELLHDKRRQVTLFSGARNDLLPGWLRWRWPEDPTTGVPPVPQIVLDEAALNPADLDGNGRADVVDRFFAQALLKLDLRERRPNINDYFADGRRFLHERLPWVLTHALADRDHTGGSWYGDRQGKSYSPDSRDRVRRLAAALSANILEARDADVVTPLVDDPTTPDIEPGAIPLPQWGPVPADNDTRFIGMERQPFLVEAFIGHVYRTYSIPGDSSLGYANSGDRILVQDDADGNPLETTVVAVQIANPYDQPISLVDDDFRYEIELFGQTPISLRAVAEALNITELPPARDDRPATMILYSIDPTFAGTSDFRTRWVNYLDLAPVDHPRLDIPNAGDPGTILVDLQRVGAFTAGVTAWDTKRNRYDNFSTVNNDGAIRLLRVQVRNTGPTGSALDKIVIDRMDDPNPGPNERSFLEEVVAQGQTVNRPPTWAELGPIPAPVPAPIPPGYLHPDGGWRPTDQSRTHWVQYVRASRAWGYDFHEVLATDPPSPSAADGKVGPYEHNPRYIYAKKVVTTAEDTAALDPRPNYSSERKFNGTGQEPGISFTISEDPDVMPWITLDYPSASACCLPSGDCADLNDADCTSLGGVPTIGWACGAINCAAPPAPLGRTNRKVTFFNQDDAIDPATGFWDFPNKGFYHSPYPLQALQKDADFQQVGELDNLWLYGHELRFAGGIYEKTERTFSEYMHDAERETPGPNGLFANRLHLGAVIGAGRLSPPSEILNDPLHAVPNLPAGVRVLEAFVCDGPGVNYDPTVDPLDQYVFGNAANFTGRATPGLLNVNTAAVESLRTLPHWYKVVHRDVNFDGNTKKRFPRTFAAEGAVSYRESFSNTSDIGYPAGPNYFDRAGVTGLPGIRAERGLAAVGELRLVNEPGAAYAPPAALRDEYTIHPNAWSLQFAAHDPFELQGPTAGDWLAANVSTDVEGPFTNPTDAFLGDGVSGDEEEMNLLFNGASNILTTRSDLFTVYFRVRSFRQNPVTGIWDATDPEQILDDSRYVMLVDRSQVNRPSDKPRILYLDKMP